MCVSCIWFFFVTFCLKLFLKKKNWSFCYGINNSFRGSALLNSPTDCPFVRLRSLVLCISFFLFFTWSNLVHTSPTGCPCKKICSYFEWTLNHISLSEGIVWIIWNILVRVISSLHWPILAHTYRLSMVKRVCSDLEWYL